MLFGNSRVFRISFYVILALTAMNAAVYFQIIQGEDISFDAESADRALSQQFQGEMVYIDPFLNFVREAKENPTDLISPLVTLRDIISGFGIDSEHYFSERSFTTYGSTVIWNKIPQKSRTRYQPKSAL